MSVLFALALAATPAAQTVAQVDRAVVAPRHEIAVLGTAHLD